MKFDLLGKDGSARRGRLSFERGIVETPAFMPVGTYGTVKAMTPEELRELGAQIILGNTFHLMLRPGMEVVRAHGGLHRFMHWDGPILTDSGGFQVWSLGKLRKISEQGVTFQSPVNGDRIFMGPEESMAMQQALGADIIMVFDECTPYPATEEQARASMELSLRWAERSKQAHAGKAGALFGIVQGGMYTHLRLESLAGLKNIGFDGYALGGLSVGDAQAVWVMNTLSAFGTNARDVVQRFKNNLREYVVHEKSMAPTASEFDAFRGEVNQLRDEVARLEKRLAKLGGQS